MTSAKAGKTGDEIRGRGEISSAIMCCACETPDVQPVTEMWAVPKGIAHDAP